MSDWEYYEKIYAILREEHPDLAQWFYQKHKKIFYEKPLYHELWPKKLGWWNDKKFDTIKEKYEPLEKILIEVGPSSRIRYPMKKSAKLFSDHLKKKHAEKDSDDSNYDKHLTKTNNGWNYPALLSRKCKDQIVTATGYSKDTIQNYLAALVRIGALRVHMLGKKGTYYSVGYWSNSKLQSGEWGFKVIPYLNHKLAKKLLDPNQFFLRK